MVKFFYLVLVSPCLLQGSIISLNQCNVSNSGTGVTLSANGPQDCALSTSSGPDGGLANVFADASTTAAQLSVSALVEGYSPIGCCIFPYTTAASSRASVQESEDLDSEGPQRPGFLQVSFGATGYLFYSASSDATVSIPGLLSFDARAPQGGAHGGCNYLLYSCTFAVTLGEVYEVDLMAIAYGYGDSGYIVSSQASAAVQFLEADGMTPAPFADPQSAPEPGSGALLAVGLFLSACGRRRWAAARRN